MSRLFGFFFSNVSEDQKGFPGDYWKKRSNCLTHSGKMGQVVEVVAKLLPFSCHRRGLGSLPKNTSSSRDPFYYCSQHMAPHHRFDTLLHCMSYSWVS